MSQINKGNIPTKAELIDVFDELPQKYYKEVALALLGAQPSVVAPEPVRTPQQPKREQEGVKMQQKPAIKAIDPNKALTPADLGKGANIFNG